MTTTTNYGTWVNHHPDGTTASTVTIEDWITSSLTEWVKDYDVPAIATAFRNAVNQALPEGVSLHGNEFIGPYPVREGASQEISDAIESVDFWALAQKHDISHVARETFTAVAYPDDLRDTNPGQAADLNEVVGCIRIIDTDGDEVDVVTYAADEDESQATENIVRALDDAGYRVPDWTSHADGLRVTVTRAQRV